MSSVRLIEDAYGDRPPPRVSWLLDGACLHISCKKNKLGLIDEAMKTYSSSLPEEEIFWLCESDDRRSPWTVMSGWYKSYYEQKYWEEARESTGDVFFRGGAYTYKVDLVHMVQTNESTCWFSLNVFVSLCLEDFEGPSKPLGSVLDASGLVPEASGGPPRGVLGGPRGLLGGLGTVRPCQRLLIWCNA